ncbi:Appr-1-p processing protein [Paenibacillaceae bacterium]|nr:Appr-1-p processing protein [Paenibacillaceae bacterium]
MIKLIEGDLLQATEDIIGHQVNCKGVMGSGVAKQLSDKYSDLLVTYKAFIEMHSPKILGKCQFTAVDNYSKIVANLFAQDGYGYGKQFTDLSALKATLTDLKFFAKRHNYSVALPYKIGSDRGGADWNVVKGIIAEVFEDYEVTLYKLEGK